MSDFFQGLQDQPIEMVEPVKGEGQLPFELLHGTPDNGLVLVCDHASNHLPREYGTLGLPANELERHIAYDIGAAEVTRHLADLLGVPALLGQDLRRRARAAGRTGHPVAFFTSADRSQPGHG